MSELTKRVRAKYPGVYDDLSDPDLERAVLAKHPEYADLTKPDEPRSPRRVENGRVLPSTEEAAQLAARRVSANQMMAHGPSGTAPNGPTSEGARGVLRMMKEHPIETGATIGSVIAPEIVGPIDLGMKAAPWITRILSATLGGAGGAGLGMTANAATGGEAPSPTTPGGVLRTMAVEGAKQGAAQATGEGLTAGAKRAAPYVYELGLGRTAANRAEFPGAAARGVREGLLPTPRRVQGRLSQAEHALTDQVQTADAATSARRAAGGPDTRVQPSDVVSTANRIATTEGRLPDRALRADAQGELADLSHRVLAENPGPLTLRGTLGMKRAEQNLSNSAYRAAERGRPVGDVEQLFHKGLAGGAREQLIAKLPEAEQNLAREQDLVGLLHAAQTRANQPAALRHYFSLLTGMGGVSAGHPGLGLGTAALIEGSRSPVLTGATGIALDRVVPKLANPTLLKAALLARLFGEDQQP